MDTTRNKGFSSCLLGEEKGLIFGGFGSQNSFFLSRVIHLESFWLNQEHMTAKSAALNTGGAEEKLKHLWNSSLSLQALILQTSSRACPAHIEIIGKQELFTRVTAGGMISTAGRHFPLWNQGCFGFGMENSGMAEPWRLLQCHRPGNPSCQQKSLSMALLSPTTSKRRRDELLGTWREGGGKANSATKSLLCSLIFI